MSIALTALVLGGLGGALFFLYAYGYLATVLGWATTKYATIKTAVVGFTGAVYSWTVDFYTGWITFLQEGLTLNEPGMTLFVVGYLLLCFVLLYNLLVTSTDGKPGVRAVR